MLLSKNESSLEMKIVFPNDLFSSEWKTNKKKESLQDEGSDIKLGY